VQEKDGVIMTKKDTPEYEVIAEVKAKGGNKNQKKTSTKKREKTNGGETVEAGNEKKMGDEDTVVAGNEKVFYQYDESPYLKPSSDKAKEAGIVEGDRVRSPSKTLSSPRAVPMPPPPYDKGHRLTVSDNNSEYAEILD